MDDYEADAISFEVSHLRQLLKHSPDNSSIGDCFRTSIACLLGALDPTDVPHFAEINFHAGYVDEATGGWEDIASARQWLRESEGLDLMYVTREAAERVGVPYKATVQSKAGDWLHCVIGHRGEVVWDPSGTGSYSSADFVEGHAVGIITTPYTPDPDTQLAELRAEAAAAELKVILDEEWEWSQ